MKPLQVYLAEAEMNRLESWATSRGWSKSQAVRAAIRALTADDEQDPLLSLSGMVQDILPEDCSEQFDRCMRETYVAEGQATYRKRRKPRLRR